MKHFIISLAILLSFAVSANGALVDNDDGTVTDTDRGIMWLQDANIAHTLGYDTDGVMTWNEANTWISEINNPFSSYYMGYSNWRRPSALNQDGSGPCLFYDCNDSEIESFMEQFITDNTGEEKYVYETC